MLPPFEVQPGDHISSADKTGAHEKLQLEIGISRQFPYRVIALTLGIGQMFALLVVAVLLRICGFRSEALDRELAGHYYNVPEMALHKKVELQIFLAEEYQGKGLDLGCGNGIIGGILTRMASLDGLHGIDHDAAAHELALANGYAAFTPAELAAIKPMEQTFDYAISICVLEHVADLDSALLKVRRLLRPGAKLIFSTPAPAYRKCLLGYRARAFFGLRASAEAFALKYDRSSMHFNILSEDEWRARLESAGFNLTRVEPIFSRFQLVVYDLLNWQIYFPRFYCADKLQNFGFNHPRLKRLACWATAVVTGAMTRNRANREDATHYFIVATTVGE